MESLAFDGLARLYDETRTFDRRCFGAAIEYLTGRFPPEEFSEVLEPGVGTGRVAFPLADKGYHVTGVDISDDMLAALQHRLNSVSPHARISYSKADVTRLPFGNASFDMAVAAHLFYFVKDWKKAADELLRVVKPVGAVVLMHTGTGTEIPFMNERYKSLCAAEGFPISELGVKSTSEVADYYARLGCHTESVRDRWVWVSKIRLDKAIRYIWSRAYSFTTATPDSVHLKVANSLKSELVDRFGTLSVAVEVTNQVYLVFIRRE